MPTEVPSELPVGDPEVRKAQTFQTKTSEQVDLVDRLNKFSCWSRAVKAVARLIRRARKVKSCDLSSVSERQSAEQLIIKDMQSQTYGEEIKLLSKGHQLPKQNKLYHLDVFLDAEGVLKVGGRLSRSSFPNTFKHPTVIPQGHHVTSLIIAHHHERVKHQGKGFTINEIRSNGYWICGLSRAVATYIRHCVTCRRLRRPVESQKMSDLPVERTEPTPPFTYCGMDCFGPFWTKQGRKEEKRWRQVQYLTEQFWSRWKKEYLHSITARQCWHGTKRNLQVGDVVMDAEDTLPRSKWRLGTVTEVIQGKDGLVRRAKILFGEKELNHKGERTIRTSLERPVQKLVLLLEAV
ncbi:uncharacterized protein LOC134865136 [Eleginops maclovinus]|uniref:uncharacterized protein LOC134865136 n=1 Tax=Eleginops maclovinus TaxID=56733 RepID=UPI003080D8BE